MVNAKETIVDEVREALLLCANEQTRMASERFFKEGEKAQVYGIKSAEVRKIAKLSFARIKDQSKAEILQYCEALWQSGYLEEAVVACVWTEALKKKITVDDFPLFERWVAHYVNNWAACDTLCNHTVGDLVWAYPEKLADLKRWAKSENRWVKRAAAVTLIVPAKKGFFLPDVFEIADILLLDADHMVQKGYGWLLKVASQAHLEEVFNYVLSKKAVMPRTALRYAIEKMPPAYKKEAMEKEL